MNHRNAHTRRQLPVENLEPRRLLAFTKPDFGFANAGTLDLGNGQNIGRISAEPLADGRVIVVDDREIRYLRGDGTADPKRGSSGARNLSQPGSSVVSTAVDAQGRVAVLRNVVNGVNKGNFLIEVFDVRGKNVLRTTFARNGRQAGERAIAFTPEGGVVVAVTAISENEDRATAEVRKFDAALSPVTVYGGDGLVEWRYASGVDLRDGTRLLGIDVDDSGRAYVFGFEAVQGGSFGREFSASVFRLDSNGNPDVAYNGTPTTGRFIEGGHYDETDQGVHQAAFEDYELLADGTVIAAVRGITSEDILLKRLAPGANASAITSAIPLANSNNDRGTARLAVAADGSVYVMVKIRASPSVSHLYKRDATTLADVRGFSDFGPYLTTTSDLGVIEPSVDANGRLYLAGAGIDMSGFPVAAVVAVNGNATDFPSVPTGTARLLPDGTLVVKGTSGRDIITVRRKSGNVLVDVGKRSYKFVGGASIRGIVALGLGGNDRLEGYASLADMPLYFDGGDGDDTIQGARGHDTLIGAGRNDSIFGSDGDDDLYGQDGNDTLYGDEGADILYGGKGDDYLAASTINAAIGSQDYVEDRLYGGAGKDFFREDHYDPEDGTADLTMDFGPGDREKSL